MLRVVSVLKNPPSPGTQVILTFCYWGVLFFRDGNQVRSTGINAGNWISGGKGWCGRLHLGRSWHTGLKNRKAFEVTCIVSAWIFRCLINQQTHTVHFQWTITFLHHFRFYNCIIFCVGGFVFTNDFRPVNYVGVVAGCGVRKWTGFSTDYIIQSLLN